MSLPTDFRIADALERIADALELELKSKSGNLLEDLRKDRDLDLAGYLEKEEFSQKYADWLKERFERKI